MNKELTSPMEEGASSLTDEEEAKLHQIEQQFSCLSTVDKEVLIKQLQKMVGEQILNEYAAAFFLDMNNWNLPQSIGSYFDLIGNTTSSNSPSIIGSTPSYSFKLEKAPTNTITLNLTPNVTLETVIKLQNDGHTRWPSGCGWRWVQGNNFCVKDGKRVEFVEVREGVEVGGTVGVGVGFERGDKSGGVEGVWQMCTPDGYLFGPLVTIRSGSDLVEEFCRLRTE